MTDTKVQMELTNSQNRQDRQEKIVYPHIKIPIDFEIVSAEDRIDLCKKVERTEVQTLTDALTSLIFNNLFREDPNHLLKNKDFMQIDVKEDPSYKHYNCLFEKYRTLLPEILDRICNQKPKENLQYHVSVFETIIQIIWEPVYVDLYKKAKANLLKAAETFHLCDQKLVESYDTQNRESFKVGAKTINVHMIYNFRSFNEYDFDIDGIQRVLYILDYTEFRRLFISKDYCVMNPDVKYKFKDDGLLSDLKQDLKYLVLKANLIQHQGHTNIL